jgi:hypothetical protein
MNLELVGNLALMAKLDGMPRNILEKLKPRMVRVGLGLVKHLKEEELSGQALKARTGTGRRSVTYRVIDDGQNLTVVAGPDLSKAKYMRAQDQGATITPQRVKNLTIPIGEALTPKGVGRFTARQVIESPGAFGYVGTFVHNRIIFGKRADKSITPLFVLKTSVRIKAVGFMAHTISEKREWAESEIAAGIKEALNV